MYGTVYGNMYGVLAVLLGRGVLTVHGTIAVGTADIMWSATGGGVLLRVTVHKSVKETTVNVYRTVYDTMGGGHSQLGQQA